MLSNNRRVCFDLRGERAIITGGCHGINRAVADALAAAGAEVEVFDVNAPAAADGFSHHFLRVDVTDPAAVARAVGTLADPPGMLVNNAGITRDRPIIKMSDGKSASILNVNRTGAFNMLRAVAPLVAARGFAGSSTLPRSTDCVGNLGRPTTQRRRPV